MYLNIISATKMKNCKQNYNWMLLTVKKGNKHKAGYFSLIKKKLK